MDGLSLYRRYLGISIRSQMEYRGSYLMQTFGHFLATGMEFVAIWALFQRFESIRGWLLAEVALFYGTVSIAFALSDALTRGFDLFGRLVKGGEFDRLLLRPRSTVLQLLGLELTLRRAGRLLQGAVVLAWAAARLEVPWTAWKVALVAWAIGGGCCLFVGLLVMQATVAFWTTESLEIMNALTYGGIETAQYPLTLYLPWFRKFFTFVVPLACVNYFPVLAVLGKSDLLGTPLWFQCLAPLAGPLFLCLGLIFWRFGQRRYASTGS